MEENGPQLSDSVEIKLKNAEEKVATYIKDLQRLQAEFENYIKRAKKEQENTLLLAKFDIMKKILPIVDEFEIALKSTQETRENEHFIEGVKMVFNHLNSLLNEEGINHTESIGKKHDPFVHEVIKKVDSEKEENVILEEIQKGYSFHGNLLRPAKVIVSNGKKEATIENSNLEVENE